MEEKFGKRSVENIVDEIEHLKTDYNIDTIAFMDDTFTLKKRKVMAICDEILKKKY